MDCPRCIKILEHVKSLAKYITSIESQDVVSICDHCLRKERPRSSCWCRRIVNKFLIGRQLEDSESIRHRIKLWLKQAQNVLRNAAASEIGESKSKMLVRSAADLNVTTKKIRWNSAVEISCKKYDLEEPFAVPGQTTYKAMDKDETRDDHVQSKQVEPTDRLPASVKFQKPTFHECSCPETWGFMKRDLISDKGMPKCFEIDAFLDFFDKSKEKREPKLRIPYEEKQFAKIEEKKIVPFKVTSFMDISEQYNKPITKNKESYLLKPQEIQIKETPKILRQDDNRVDHVQFEQVESTDRPLPSVKVRKPLFPQNVLTDSQGLIKRDPSSDGAMQKHLGIDAVLDLFDKKKEKFDTKFVMPDEKQLEKKEAKTTVPLKPKKSDVLTPQEIQMKETHQRSSSFQQEIFLGRKRQGSPPLASKHRSLEGPIKSVSEHDLAREFKFLFPDEIKASSLIRFASSSELLKRYRDTLKAQAREEQPESKDQSIIRERLKMLVNDLDDEIIKREKKELAIILDAYTPTENKEMEYYEKNQRKDQLRKEKEVQDQEEKNRTRIKLAEFARKYKEKRQKEREEQALKEKEKKKRETEEEEKKREEEKNRRLLEGREKAEQARREREKERRRRRKQLQQEAAARKIQRKLEREALKKQKAKAKKLNQVFEMLQKLNLQEIARREQEELKEKLRREALKNKELEKKKQKELKKEQLEDLKLKERKQKSVKSKELPMDETSKEKKSEILQEILKKGTETADTELTKENKEEARHKSKEKLEKLSNSVLQQLDKVDSEKKIKEETEKLKIKATEKGRKAETLKQTKAKEEKLKEVVGAIQDFEKLGTETKKEEEYEKTAEKERQHDIILPLNEKAEEDKADERKLDEIKPKEETPGEEKLDRLKDEKLIKATDEKLKKVDSSLQDLEKRDREMNKQLKEKDDVKSIDEKQKDSGVESVVQSKEEKLKGLKTNQEEESVRKEEKAEENKLKNVNAKLEYLEKHEKKAADVKSEEDKLKAEKTKEEEARIRKEKEEKLKKVIGSPQDLEKKDRETKKQEKQKDVTLKEEKQKESRGEEVKDTKSIEEKRKDSGEERVVKSKEEKLKDVKTKQEEEGIGKEKLKRDKAKDKKLPNVLAKVQDLAWEDGEKQKQVTQTEKESTEKMTEKEKKMKSIQEKQDEQDITVKDEKVKDISKEEKIKDVTSEERKVKEKLKDLKTKEEKPRDVPLTGEKQKEDTLKKDKVIDVKSKEEKLKDVTSKQGQKIKDVTSEERKVKDATLKQDVTSTGEKGKYYTSKDEKLKDVTLKDKEVKDISTNECCEKEKLKDLKTNEEKRRDVPLTGEKQKEDTLEKDKVIDVKSKEEKLKDVTSKQEKLKDVTPKDDKLKDLTSKENKVKDFKLKEDKHKEVTKEENLKDISTKERKIKDLTLKEEKRRDVPLTGENQKEDTLKKDKVIDVKSKEEKLKDVTSKQEKLKDVTPKDDKLKDLTSKENKVKDFKLKEDKHKEVTKEENLKDISTKERKIKDLTLKEEKRRDVPLTGENQKEDTLKKDKVIDVKSKEEKLKDVTSKQEMLKDVTPKDDKLKDLTSKENKVKDFKLKEDKHKEVTKEEDLKDISTKERKIKDLTLKEEKVKEDTSKDEKLRDVTSKQEKPKYLKSKEDTVKDITAKDVKIKDVTAKEDLKDISTKEGKIKDVTSKEIKFTNRKELILELIRLKQSQYGPRERFNVSDIESSAAIQDTLYNLYDESDLLLELMDLDLEAVPKQQADISVIIGNKIFKRRLEYKTDPEFNYGVVTATPTETKAKPLSRVLQPTQHTIYADSDAAAGTKGIIRYALSDRSFIDKGWTMLPTEKVVRKMNVYRMRPAHPEFDWFEHNKYKRMMQYDTGEVLADFDDDGRGRWFYRSGKVALDYYNAEEINAQQRFVVYSSGEPDDRGRSRPITVLATFDYLGNGVVFDHGGKIRLKYNQTEGIVLDRSIGPVSNWKWHTLNDPPVLQQVMIDTQMPYKDPNIVKLGSPSKEKVKHDNEEMLAIEFDNFIKEKSRKLTQKFKPFQIKMKALKINEYFSLRVLDQASVYLLFRDGSTNIKINIGMVLDHKEIVDTDTAEVGEVSNSLERLPARTDSLAALQRAVVQAQRTERARVRHERRLNPLEPTASVDQIRAATSRPLRRPLLTESTEMVPNTQCPPCPCRKPSTTNLYYSTYH